MVICSKCTFWYFYGGIQMALSDGWVLDEKGNVLCPLCHKKHKKSVKKVKV